MFVEENKSILNKCSVPLCLYQNKDMVHNLYLVVVVKTIELQNQREASGQHQ